MIVEKKCREVESVISTKEESKIDISLLRKKGNSKTYKGLLLQKMKEAKQQNNLEVCQLLQWCYKEYLGFETSEKLKYKIWKGKSSMRLIEEPDRFILITWQRYEPGESPKEIQHEISKEEVNQVLKEIYALNKGEKIPTPVIGANVCHKYWKEVFSDRETHIRLCQIYNILALKKIIHYYKRGFVEVLR